MAKTKEEMISIGRGINKKRNERIEKGRQINKEKSGQYVPKKKVYA